MTIVIIEEMDIGTDLDRRDIGLAGGKFDSWTVGMEDVFRLLAGQRPMVDAVVTPARLNQARDKSNWTL